MNGYDVLIALQLNPHLKNIPFIFLTAKTEDSDVNKGIELGADEYLFKPVRKLELLDAIKSCLENSSLKEN